MPPPTLPPEAVLDALPDAVLVLAPGGAVAQANRRAGALFGREPAALAGHRLDALVRGRDASEPPVDVTTTAVGEHEVAVVRELRDAGDAERARQQAGVAELGRRALSGLELGEVMQAAAEMLAEVLDVPCVEVLELGPDREGFALRGTVGWDHGPRVPVAGTQVGLSVQRRAPVTVRDTATERRFDTGPLRSEHGIVSGIAVPMLLDDDALGAIGVHAREPRAFTDDDVHFVQTVANVVAATMQRRRAEEELERSASRLEAVLDASPMPIVLKDVEGRIIVANRGFERAWDLQPGTAISLRSGDIADGEMAEIIDVSDRAVIATGEPVEVERRLQIHGRDCVFLVSKFPLLDRAGRAYGLGVVATDVTERVELEARLALAQRLESVGQLAGGIAHDFNNLLAVISNYAGFVADAVTPRSQAAEDVQQIIAACRRAGELTQRLLVFSRRRSGNPEVLDLASAIADTERLLRRTLGGPITLHTEVERDLWRVEADRGQLEQVLINLAINARDAMPGGGRLEIRARNVVLRDDEANGLRGPAVCLSVTDTGTGMEPDVAERAFEPFFTTKAPGEGTGLGLSTVYGIVRGAGGRVRISSTPGEGTSIVLHLPATTAPAARRPAHERQAPPRGRGERVLVVEDHEAIRELASRILGDGGYDVRVAADGREALDVHDGDVDVLLTDVVMPGLGGLELADELRRHRPALPVVLISGYTEDYVAESARDDATAYVEKPFTAVELLTAVRRVLEA